MGVLDFDTYVPAADGSFISERHSRVAELIKNYNANLDVRWIPPANRSPDDPAFCIVERTKSGKELIAFYCDDLNDDILGMVYRGDNSKGNVLDALEAHNKAVRDIDHQTKLDERQERKELTAAILKSPKSIYKHNGVTYQ